MSVPADARTEGSAVGARVPDFFIVGHHKCGTTALYEMLRRHPQIFMPRIKEPRFLASDMRSRFQQARGQALPETLEEYLALFASAGAGQRAGEATPSYLFSATAAANMARLAPSARSVAILREPASFIRSLHMQLLRSHVETEQSLRRAIELEPDRAEGRHVPRRSHLPQLLRYSEHVRYVDQLSRYHAVFAREQMKVLIYDDFRRDNEGSVREVLRFLEVDDSLPFETLEVKQTERTIRSQGLDDVLRTVTVGRSRTSSLARSAVKTVTSRSLRHAAFRTARRRGVFADVPPADEELMGELRVRFKPEVVALSEYLDRDLVALWGYDALG